MIFYNKQIFDRCFAYRGRYWYKNIGRIPRYFKLIHHLIKYGYDKYAIWETFDWFIYTMKSILERYRSTHTGVPILIEDYPFDSSDDSKESKEKRKSNDELWDSIIDKMICLLDDMDENNPKYRYLDFREQDKLIEEAKNEFFKLFSEYFYNLWD